MISAKLMTISQVLANTYQITSSQSSTILLLSKGIYFIKLTHYIIELEAKIEFQEIEPQSD